MKHTTTERGFRRIEFDDRNGAECSLQESSLATEPAIWLGPNHADPKILVPNQGWQPLPFPEGALFNTRMHLTAGQVITLLPLLHHFATTGQLPAPPPYTCRTSYEFEAAGETFAITEVTDDRIDIEGGLDDARFCGTLSESDDGWCLDETARGHLDEHFSPGTADAIEAFINTNGPPPGDW